ncbi:hypothetical protein [Neobacillus bataviensis]|uniref:hypothetical protein n=1 Tax=Neobacillus bataviensis TaxID=220685 RepID=UPI001CBDDC61|nr:hypothetical protein [Neobacillus bataviensis]
MKPASLLNSRLFFCLDVNVDFETLLIGAEGARLLREDGAGETPQALKRRGGSPDRPRKAKRLERKSTAKLKTAFYFWKSYHEFVCNLIL